MSSHSYLLVAAALLAAPAPTLLAQSGQPRAEARQGQMGPRSPVAALLAHRAELKLTADQVTRLEAIHQELERQNQPLVQQLGAFRGSRPQGQGEPTQAEREAMRQRREQARPVMQQLRENNRAGMERAQALLTPEQKALAQTTLRQQRGPRRPGGQTQSR